MWLSAFERGEKEILPDLVIKNLQESENSNYCVKDLVLDGTVQCRNVSKIIEFFESEATVMAVCHCSSFDDEGCPLYYRLDHKPDPAWLEELPSPYISFGVDYADRDTGRYVFSVITYINSNSVRYLVEKAKQATEIKPHKHTVVSSEENSATGNDNWGADSRSDKPAVCGPDRVDMWFEVVSKESDNVNVIFSICIHASGEKAMSVRSEYTDWGYHADWVDYTQIISVEQAIRQVYPNQNAVSKILAYAKEDYSALLKELEEKEGPLKQMNH